MKRRDFFTGDAGRRSRRSGQSAEHASQDATALKRKTELKLSFQEGTAPGETLEQKFDFMEQNGVVGFEPGGAGLAARVGERKTAARTQHQVSAICAGFQGFILSEDEAVRQQFDQTMREIIAAAGELGSTGVIMVPAFNGQVPAMPHTMDTRNYLVDQLRQLGDYAVQCGTTVILEPLNRNEAFYLRQVGDAASICRDAKHPAVKCMGDFWHMTFEEPSDYGAFFSAGEHPAARAHRQPRHPQHARRRRRRRQLRGRLPRPESDELPRITSTECGCKGDRAQSVPAALKLIREQWDMA